MNRVLISKIPLNNSGFSLLELLIVLGLIATAATLALSVVDNSDNQNRFEETRRKLAVIQNAILGTDPNANTTNNVDGFVSDMGRLPLSLNELLTEPTDCDPDTAGNQTCAWQFDADSEIWHGWNGPYIRTLNADFRDGWGNDWSWDLSVANQLTIGSFGLDTDTDLTTNNLTGTNIDYGDSTLQTVAVTNNQHRVPLPFNPLYLDINSPSVCGQCRADGITTQASCNAAGFFWDPEHLYCVNDDISVDSAADCDAETSTTWVPVYGDCDIPGINRESNCTSAGGTWTPATACTIPHYDFTDGENEICARVIRVNHGSITNSSHRSDDTNTIDLTVNSPSSSGDDSFVFSPMMETDEATPTAELTLAQGPIRIGLYIYNDLTNTCTTNPFPSASAQGLSDIIQLNAHTAPNVGVSSNPIQIDWRSSL
ncbi:prepilin-type N-terminal cleavage/methylation domain-containing protein [Sessilibacter corallicola]